MKLVPRGTVWLSSLAPPRPALIPLAIAFGLLAAPGGNESHGQGVGISATARNVERTVAGAGSTISFSHQVAPILNRHCGNCHVRGSKGDFSMASYARLSGKRGVISPGNPRGSSLVTLIESGKMPPKGSVPTGDLAIIRSWVQSGAAFDGGDRNLTLDRLGSGAANSGRAPQGSGGPPAGYGGRGPTQGPGGPPAGYGGRGPTQGPGGPPPGYGGRGPTQSSGGPPPGYGGRGPSQSSGGPPPGYGGRGPAPSSGGPPPGYGGRGPSQSGGGPPPGYGSRSGYGPEGEGMSGDQQGGSSGSEYGEGYGSSGSEYGPGYGSSGSEYGPGYDSSSGGSEGGPGYGSSSGYDSSSGYGGGPRGARGGGSQSDFTRTYAANVVSSLSDVDWSALFAPAPIETVAEAGPVLRNESEQAFAAGNSALALQLAFGHMAAEYPQSVVDVQSVKYSKTLQRPVWSVRLGVSMSVRGPTTLTDPSPIRDTGGTGRGGGGSRGGGPGEGYGERDIYGEGYGSESSGPEMREQVEPRGPEMGYGPETGYGPGSSSGSRAASAPATTSRSMLDPAAAKELDETVGLVAELLGDGLSKRFQSGDFGPLLTSVPIPTPPADTPQRGGAPAPIVPTPGGSMSGELAELLAEAPEALPMWVPAIVYLGQDSEDALATARAAGLDYLVSVDVVLKPGRQETMQNLSRVRLRRVANGKLMVISKGMDSTEAEQLASSKRSTEREYVEEQLANLFAVIDRDVKATEMPQLSPEVAKKRVATLMASSQARSLRTLAEVRLYHSLQLINTDDVEAAFDIIGGPEALTMLHGPATERAAIARQWAMRAVGGRPAK